MSAEPVVTTTAIAPTLTQVFDRDVRNVAFVSLQVTNLNGSQVMSGFLRSSVNSQLAGATSTMPDFVSLQPAGSVDADGNPTDSVTADIDCGGRSRLQFYMRASGAGGNVSWTLRSTGPKS